MQKHTPGHAQRHTEAISQHSTRAGDRALAETLVVTGGAGFIGSHVARRLLEKGHRVIVVDDLSARGSSEEAERLQRLGAELVRVDVSDYDALLAGLRSVLRGEKPLAVLHLAAVVSLEAARRDPLRAAQVNTLGTVNAALAAAALGAERLVYASTAAVYGEPQVVPVPETHPASPANVYGETKLAGERLAAQVARDRGLHMVSLRLFNVYGPGMRPGPYSGVVLRFAEALLEGRQPVIYGDGNQTRDFVHVDDVARAFEAALETPYRGPVNIGTGRETSVKELLKEMCRQARRLGLLTECPEPVHAEPRPGDVRRSAADTRLARAALHWSPSRTLEEGLRETLEWLARSRGERRRRGGRKESIGGKNVGL